MQWSDRAIILSLRKFAETSAVITLFSREHGVYSGVSRGALSKAQRGIFLPGNLVVANWKARLAEHVGTLSAELDLAVAALVMQDAQALAALNSLTALIPLAIHERDPHPPLWDALMYLLARMADGKPWQMDYIRFELLLLQEAGFGLSLEECAATGSRDNLIYVSPKSGAAVSEEAGAPWREKLLPLPTFLNDHSNDASAVKDLHQGFSLTGYFIEKWLLSAIGKPMPQARMRLAATFT